MQKLRQAPKPEGEYPYAWFAVAFPLLVYCHLYGLRRERRTMGGIIRVGIAAAIES